MEMKGFEGWYFKHRRGRDMLAFIPGRAESGAFVQMLGASGSRHFAVPELTVERGVIRAGACSFSRQGCTIDLPGVRGEIAYGAFTPLRSDIMGPFCFLPMECRHGVISMAHDLHGSVCVDGSERCFDGGTGYIEKDSGVSFPSAYQWVQCNAFPQSCSVMASIATIPLCGARFRGCICAVIYRGREYRLATYTGVRILAAQEGCIRLAQGGVLLELDIRRPHAGHPLCAPRCGQMCETIRESGSAAVRARLWERGEQVFDLCSDGASYEYVPPRRGE